MGFLDSALSSSTQIQSAEELVSGGGISHDGKFSYGYASSPGKRSSMEDFYDMRIDGVDGEVVGLFGVFDGHGGVRAAEYVKKNLFSNLMSHPKFISDTKSAIADAYNHTDSEFLKSENTHNRDAGSTASTAILVGDRLLVANVGDSRAVICRGGNAIAVSRDHKPDQTDERQRIEDAGGFVMWAGTWRVGGVLAVSRAFGDRLLKQYVVADPEIQEEKVDSSLEFLILASDGLWDVVTNEEAVAMIKPIEDAEESAKRLMQEAYQRGSADNITCLVVRFLINTGTSSHSNSGGKNQGISSQSSSGGKNQSVSIHGSSNSEGKNQGTSSHSSSGGKNQGVSSHSSSEGKNQVTSSQISSSGKSQGVSSHSSSEGKNQGVSSHSSSGGKNQGASSHSSSGEKNQGVSAHSNSEGKNQVTSSQISSEGKNQVTSHSSSGAKNQGASSHSSSEGKIQVTSSHSSSGGKNQGTSSLSSSEGKIQVTSSHSSSKGKSQDISTQSGSGGNNRGASSHINSEKKNQGTSGVARKESILQ